MQAVNDHPRGATLAISVQPRASRTELVGEQDGVLKIRLAAPPVDGAANAELIAYLSKLLRVRKSDVQILSGERGRRKVVLIVGVDAAAVNKRLGVD